MAGQAWLERVEQFWEAMGAEEAEEFRAAALIALDEATRRRELTAAELARLSALGEYLANRLARRQEDAPLALQEALLYGLLAGYQLGVAGD